MKKHIGDVAVLGNAALTWAYNERDTVGLSTMEAEYQSAYLCGGEVVCCHGDVLHIRCIAYQWFTLSDEVVECDMVSITLVSGLIFVQIDILSAADRSPTSLRMSFGRN